MNQYFIAFVGKDENGGIVIKNDCVRINADELSMEDVKEIQEFVGRKHKLVTCAVINIIKLTED